MMSIKTTAGAVIGFIIVAILVSASFNSFYTVDQGERAVTLRNGAITGTAEPGLHFKMPFIEDYQRVSTQTHTVRFDKIESYSRDQQPATLVVSVSFQVPPAEVEGLYSRYGSIRNMNDRLVTRRVLDQVKTTFGQFTAISAVQNRADLSKRLNDAVIASMEGQPVRIEGVQIEEISYSPAYESSVEDRMKAEVAVFTRQQNLETERINAEIAVTQAKGRADSAVAEAKAKAEAVRLAGEAEAAAISAKGEALRANPGLVELVAAERWNGELPQTMVPGAAVPFVKVN
uniref:prohibitin family protein n=1 Tax=Castellaniella defragrans TaxID=75697 RepID=UPI003340A6F8